MAARSTSPWLTAGMVALVTGLVLVAVRLTRPDLPRSKAPDPVPAPVEVLRLEMQIRSDTVTAFGESSPARIATLASEIPGKVSWRSPALEVGGEVVGGEVLLHLDDTLSRLTMNAAAAGLDARKADANRQKAALKTALEQEILGQREVERLEKLVQAGDASETLLDQARAAFLTSRSFREGAEHSLRVARASQAEASILLEKAGEMVARHQIRAAFKGEVSRPSAEGGDWLAQGSPVCLLVDRRSLKIKVQVPSEAVPGLGPDTRVKVRFPAFQEAGRALVVAGNLMGIDPVARSDSRSREAVLLIPNPDGLLPMGAFAEIEFDKGSQAAIWLRPAWFALREQGPVAYVVAGGERVEARALGLGRPVFDDQGRAWHPATRGLAPGDLLVVGNVEVLSDGSRVTVLRRPPASLVEPPTSSGEG